MTRNLIKLALWLSLALQLLTLVLLISGSSWIEQPILHDPLVPLGTPLVWFSMAAFPFNFFWLSGRRLKPGWGKLVVRGLFGLAVLVGCGWGIVGYILCGNWSYNFKNDQQAWEQFVGYNNAWAGLILTGILAWGIAGLWRWVGKRRASG